MFLVGLTGGIAAGKSTVAARLVELGAVEIDADKLAREVVEPGTEALSKIESEFGSSVISADGSLDRKTLGSIVFSSTEARLKLEAIVHPAVRALSLKRVSEQPEDAIVVYNVPLLVEAKVDLPFDFVITVETPEKEQIKRLIENRAMTAEAALSIINAQAKPADRANVADAIVNANQSMVLMLKDVDQLWRKIEQLSDRKRESGGH
jgi:dephospho-CoA kinase